MNCINYKWPIEQAESLTELESIVERMLKQFEVEYFQVLYPDLTWGELGELLSEEQKARFRFVILHIHIYTNFLK